MQRIMCKSKIHRATVTQSELHYVGSITIDKSLMESADILPYEQVQIADITNGNRFYTYAIEGARDSGVICINGAAARLVQPGDLVIIISYAQYNEVELTDFKPTVIFVDENNKMQAESHNESSHLLDLQEIEI